MESNSFQFIGPRGNLVWAHRHKNPDGSVGGWVADSAEIGGNVVISPTAIVGPNVRIVGTAIIDDCEIATIDENA